MARSKKKTAKKNLGPEYIISSILYERGAKGNKVRLMDITPAKNPKAGLRPTGTRTSQVTSEGVTKCCW